MPTYNHRLRPLPGTAHLPTCADHPLEPSADHPLARSADLGRSPGRSLRVKTACLLAVLEPTCLRVNSMLLYNVVVCDEMRAAHVPSRATALAFKFQHADVLGPLCRNVVEKKA